MGLYLRELLLDPFRSGEESQNVAFRYQMVLAPDSSRDFGVNVRVLESGLAFRKLFCAGQSHATGGADRK